MEILVKFGNHTILAKSIQNEALERWSENLPLTLEFDDYHHIAKASYLTKKLDTEYAREYSPKKGDVIYDTEKSNLLFYYEDSDVASSNIFLGTFEDQENAVSLMGNHLVRIELAHN